jgi:hypothetical protein
MFFSILFSCIINNHSIEIGDKLRNKMFIKKEKMMYHAGYENYFHIRVNNVLYKVLIYPDNTIRVITTRDPNFLSLEGFHINSTYGDIKSFLNNVEIIRHPDYKYIQLPSGWRAVFSDKDINYNSKVTWFVKL